MPSLPRHAPRADHAPVDHAIQSRLLTTLIDRIECGVVACGADSTLVLANAAARREFERGRSLCIVDNRVRGIGAAHAGWSTALADATLRQRCSLVGIDDGAERLTVALMPVHVDGLAAPVALAVMGRRGVCSPLGLEMLASSHGLTLAESRVFRALVGNRTAREIADSHGVAVATVRTQIQAVRDKLGVRSIDALLLRAAELPPVTAFY